MLMNSRIIIDFQAFHSIILLPPAFSHYFRQNIPYNQFISIYLQIWKCFLYGNFTPKADLLITEQDNWLSNPLSIASNPDVHYLSFYLSIGFHFCYQKTSFVIVTLPSQWVFCLCQVDFKQERITEGERVETEERSDR